MMVEAWEAAIACLLVGHLAFQCGQLYEQGCLFPWQEVDETTQ